MARDGYLILDSDLHMMEPDDLWARYLATPYRANPPRFFGAHQQQLAESSADKGNADTIEGMEVQGLAIPAHGKSPGAAASRGELRGKSRAAHPHPASSLRSSASFSIWPGRTAPPAFAAEGSPPIEARSRLGRLVRLISSRRPPGVVPRGRVRGAQFFGTERCSAPPWGDCAQP